MSRRLLLHGFGNDLRHAARALRRSPGFTATAVVMLGVGLTATTTIYAGIDAVLLRPPPAVRAPERLVHVGRGRDPSRFDTFSYPDFALVRDRARTLDGAAAYAARPVSLGVAGQAETAIAEVVSAGYFDVLGVRPVLGRDFTRDEERDGEVAIVSDAFWRRRLGGDRRAIGATIRVEGQDVRVVGVAPPRFVGVDLASRAPDLWLPIGATRLVLGDATLTSRASANWLWVVGRLAPGATEQAARDEMRAIVAEIRRIDPMFADDRVNVSGGIGVRPEARRDAAIVSAALLALAALVLAVSCANLGGLFVARSVARRREIAIRMAVGGSSVRIGWQLLHECLLVAAFGALVAFVATQWTARLLAATMPYDSAVPFTADHRVAFVAQLVALVATSLLAVSPLRHALRDGRSAPLAAHARAEAGERHRARRVLVAAQIAAAYVLLASAVALERSVRLAHARDLGLDAEHLIALPITVPRGASLDPMLARVRAAPEVTAAALAAQVPIGSSRATRVVRPAGADADWYAPPVEFDVVTDDYFRTLGVALLAGRALTREDGSAAGSRVVMVNASLARRFWPDADPIGRNVVYRDGSDDVTARVVGVVRDTRRHGPREAPAPMVYLPMPRGSPPVRLQLLVRTHLPADAERTRVSDDLAAIARSADPDLAASVAVTGRALVTATLQDTQLVSTFAATFSLAAAGMALVGLYGVVAYDALRRTREIGIRIALGASARQTMRFVVREGSRALAVGLTVGVAASVPALRGIARFLDGASPADPRPLLLAALSLAVAALGAVTRPAWRALRADPVASLRS